MDKLELMKKILSIQNKLQADESIDVERRLWYGFACSDIINLVSDEWTS